MRAEEGEKVLFTNPELQYFSHTPLQSRWDKLPFTERNVFQGRRQLAFLSERAVRVMIATRVLRGSVCVQIGFEIEQGEWFCQQFKPCSQ